MKFLLPLIIISLASFETILSQSKANLDSLVDQLKLKDSLNFLRGDKDKITPPYITYNMPLLKAPDNIDYKIKIFTPPDSIDYKMNYFRIPGFNQKKDNFPGIPPGKKYGLPDSLFKLLPRKDLK